MAASAPKPQSPLPKMDKLSSCVYLYKPASPAPPATNSATPAPKLILYGTWMGARDPHIAKYFTKLQELYPTSQILLVKSKPDHFIKPETLERGIQAAVPVLRHVLDTKTTNTVGGSAASRQPELLAYLASNGGSAILRNLYSAYYEQVKRDGSNESPYVPAHVKVFDSAPGNFSFEGTMAAMTAGLPTVSRLLYTPVLWVLYAWWKFLIVFMGRQDQLTKSWIAHLERDERSVNELRRTYIYSDADKMVKYKEVEQHAAESEKTGFLIRKEFFKGTEHVAHMRSDPERYWRIVQETWDGKGFEQ